ncbi:hypothetical protein IB279_18415 [Ensifer sp. ENS06]|uniref:hypothetical protein n=1 Tax=Ensifer sp. ENS06 TaxID=2769276 RepID=UPI00177E6893|nr:hypothetical protein [Ensifer sp. ENS06]MBD9624907.1 hypothetical protein [Ensifer sp. ENS06]
MVRIAAKTTCLLVIASPIKITVELRLSDRWPRRWPSPDALWDLAKGKYLTVYNTPTVAASSFLLARKRHNDSVVEDHRYLVPEAVHEFHILGKALVPVGDRSLVERQSETIRGGEVIAQVAETIVAGGKFIDQAGPVSETSFHERDVATHEWPPTPVPDRPDKRTFVGIT